MNALKIILMVSLTLTSSKVASEEGLIAIKSNHDFETTSQKLSNILTVKGMTLFSVVKHSESAKNVGVELRPTKLFIFGNPKIGSKIMKCSQGVAIDLPQKILVWTNNENEVWLSYNDPAYLKARHKIEHCDEILSKVSSALNNIAVKAAN